MIVKRVLLGLMLALIVGMLLVIVGSFYTIRQNAYVVGQDVARSTTAANAPTPGPAYTLPSPDIAYVMPSPAAAVPAATPTAFGGPNGQLLPWQALDQGDAVRPYWTMHDSPSIYVVAAPQEVDYLIEYALGGPTNSPQFAERLRQIDYTQAFAVLVIRAVTSSSSHDITVQQVARDGNNVFIRAYLHEPPPGAAVTADVAEPYQLIAVTKQGAWNEALTFSLLADSRSIAQTRHFVP